MGDGICKQIQVAEMSTLLQVHAARAHRKKEDVSSLGENVVNVSASKSQFSAYGDT